MYAIHTCTWVFGNTVAMASGNPLKPSTQAINTSLTPRFFSSVNIDSQNLAPSFSDIHSPSNPSWPWLLTPSATVDRFVDDALVLADFDHDTIQVQNRIDGVQRRVCHSTTLSSTASVTWDTRAGEMSAPYSSAKVSTMSRVVMPLA